MRRSPAGELGIDKVVELARFATPQDEVRLIRWAGSVSSGAIRRRGDLLRRAEREEAAEDDRCRYLSWWWSYDGRMLGLEAELPADQGAVVVKALERAAAKVPVMPDEDDGLREEARLADALVVLCSSSLARDGDLDRATIVVHARAEDLVGGRGARVENGPVINSAIVDKLLCNARVQTVTEDSSGSVAGMGRLSREPSAAMLRQLRYRDEGCLFPGCGSRRFTQAHHVVWWGHGGRTDLDNLILICSFHHKLVHEHGWSLRRAREGEVSWFRPGGKSFQAGPSPPARSVAVA